MAYKSKFKGKEIDDRLALVKELSEEIKDKQDNIEDLEYIRDGARKGASALQTIPEEYVTETELEGKGYATVTQVNEKQDAIFDLDTIRANSEKGANALQEIPSEYITESELNNKGFLTQHQDISHLATKSELTDTKVTDVANHYAPAEDDSAAIEAPEGEVVIGLKRDAAGHVVGVMSTPMSSGEGGGEGEVQETSIVASQIFLELHTDLDDFQVFSHKSGYEEHNRKVCQRLIENCFTDKTPNNEVFFVTINGLRDGVPYMETAILESPAGEIVRASFVKGNINPTNLIAASIGVLGIDVENLRSYVESGEDLFYWKYTSTLVPSVDAIGSESESDVYVTEFTFEQVTRNGTTVAVSRAFVDAVYSKKIILVPYRTAYMVAYSAQAEIPEKTTNVNLRLFFGGIEYISTLSSPTIPTGGTRTIQVSVTTTTYISDTLSTINGVSLLGGKNIPLAGTIVVNGDTFTPDAKGVVDLGEITVDEVKFANDLTGVVEATPEMFTYRPSAGDKSVRDESAVIRRIKGNTNVWAQGEGLVKITTNKGVTITHESDGVIILSGEPTSDSIHVGYLKNTIGHIYLCVVEVLSMGGATSFVAGNLNLTYNKFTSVGSSATIRASTANIPNTYIGVYSVVGLYDGIKLRYQQFDLTTIFGAGNEPTTYEEFRACYPEPYYPYCAPEVREMRATGIETVGFNQWDEQWEQGSFSTVSGNNTSSSTQIRSKNKIEILGGKTYYCNTSAWGIFYDYKGDVIEGNKLSGDVYKNVLNISSREFVPPIEAVSMRFYSTAEYGGMYNNDICIHLSHSGVRNGEYKPYEKNTLLLPEIAKYFPEGMHGIGDVCDEINEEMAIQRCAVRAYEEGDENNAEVKTDKITTVYKLTVPVYTPIDELLQLDYKVDDFGTERMLSDEPSSPFKADIVYQFNAEGRIRDNSRNIEKLEKLVKQPSDWLEDNPSSPAFIKNKPTMPTAIAPVTEVIVEYSLPSVLLPNVIHEVAVGLEALTMPPLYQGDSMTRNVYKMVFVAPEASKITFPYSVCWRDGIAPNWANSGDVVEVTFTTMAEVTTILGEWKLYK